MEIGATKAVQERLKATKISEIKETSLKSIIEPLCSAIFSRKISALERERISDPSRS